MERIHKAKNTIARSLQKLSHELSAHKLTRPKPKPHDFFSQRSSKKLSSVSTTTLHKINPKLKHSNLEPLSGDNIRMSKNISLRSKRNMSVEDNYEEADQEDRTLKRNSSLIENYSKEEVWDSCKTPYTPAVTLKRFAKYLTTFEHSEILSHRNIYYIAVGVNKLEPRMREINSGFDDERNDYILVKNDHIAYRYEILEIIGRGSYGQVIRAFDHKERKNVAVKIIRNMSCIIQQAKIEIQVLYKLIQQGDPCPYLVSIVDNWIFRNHIIQTFDLLDMNLYQHLKSKSFSALPINAIKLYTQQLLEGIKYYQNLNILHCDLKPENIMLNPEKSKITIIDFGSACFSNRRIFTYIQSRYYRAPEVILEIGYDYKIDIWSLACVVAELWTGRPVFPGKDELDQLFCMIEVIGLPPAYLLENSPKCQVVLETIKKLSISATPGKGRIPGSKSLKQLVKNSEPQFYDFLSSKVYIECLVWNPSDRLSASEALEHDWFQTSPMQKNPSLPELKWDKILLTSTSSIKKKSIIDQPLTHRVLRKKSLV